MLSRVIKRLRKQRRKNTRSKRRNFSLALESLEDRRMLAAGFGGADGDGVMFGSMMVGAAGAPITVNVQGTAGMLDAWIDFNGDGAWDGANEQVFASQVVVVGDNNLTIDVPIDATAGTTDARFRISSAGGTTVDGTATDGETEDYLVTIANATPTHFTEDGGPVVVLDADVIVVETTAPFKPVGTAFRVNTFTENRQYDSTVAMDSSGRSVVIWTSYGQDGIGASIYGQRYDATGARAGDEFLVSTFLYNSQERPSLAMDATGNFVVIWQGSQDGFSAGRELYGKMFNADGVEQGDEFRVSSTDADQYSPSVAMDAVGNFVVTWQVLDGTLHRDNVYGRVFNAVGAAQGSEFIVSTSHSSTPSVDMDSVGNFVVTWQGYQDGSGLDVYGQRFDAAGVAQGSQILVNTTTNADQSLPSVAVDSTGNFVVVWRNYDENFQQLVYGQRYDSDGVPRGNEFAISPPSTFLAQTDPSVTMDSNGNFIVTFEGYPQSGEAPWGIYGQAYGSDGTREGREFYVNRYELGHQQSVAMNAAGSVVVSWTRGILGGGILAQKYSGSFSQNPQINAARIAISNLPDGADEILAVDTTGTNITASFAGGILALSGVDTPEHYEQVLQTLTYDNTSQDPNTDDRLVTFVVTVDGQESGPLTSIVHVNAINDGPVASADDYLMHGATHHISVVGVLANDNDVEGSNLSAVLVTPPSFDSSFVLNADGSFTYTPGAGFAGTDSFTYVANDGLDDSDPVTVSIRHALYVTNTTDAGEGSLRWTIDNANAHPNDVIPDEIRFAIGTGAQTVVLADRLPYVTDPVIIDGSSQPGFTGEPSISIDATAYTGTDAILRVRAGSSTVQDIALTNAASFGIFLDLNGGNLVSNVDVSWNGSTDSGTGVFINGIDNNTLRDVTGTNRAIGVRLRDSSHNTVESSDFHSSGGAIHLEGSSGENTIDANDLSSSYIGIRDQRGTGSNNQFMANNLSDSIWYAIIITGNDNPFVLADNDFTNAAVGLMLIDFSDVTLSPSATFDIDLSGAQRAIILNNATNVVVEGFDLSGTSASSAPGNFGAAIQASGTNVTIRNIIARDRFRGAVAQDLHDSRIIDSDFSWTNPTGLGNTQYGTGVEINHSTGILTQNVTATDRVTGASVWNTDDSVLKLNNLQGSNVGINVKGDSDANLFELNDASETFRGIRAAGTGRGNQYVSNDLSGVGDYGLYVSEDDQFVISDNDFTGSSGGVRLANMSDVILTPSSTFDIDISTAGTSHAALSLVNIVNSTVMGMDLSFAAASRQGVGLEITDGSQITVEAASVFGRATGVRVINSTDNLIHCSQISNNDLGIRTDGSTAGLVVTGNRIEGNGTGVYNSTAASVLAEDNFWGATDGPSNDGGSGDSYYGNVDADPFLDGLPACLVTSLSAGGTYTVDEGSSIPLQMSATPGAPNSTSVQWDYDYDGITFDVNATGLAPTFDAASLDGPSTPTIAVRVQDSSGTTAVSTTSVTVHNVAPTLTVPLPGVADQEQTIRTGDFNTWPVNLPAGQEFIPSLSSLDAVELWL
ncbi:MAG: parallel beta-helix repeat protein, partial [Planctomycetaceae bacterium]